MGPTTCWTERSLCLTLFATQNTQRRTTRVRRKPPEGKRAAHFVSARAREPCREATTLAQAAQGPKSTRPHSCSSHRASLLAQSAVLKMATIASSHEAVTHGSQHQCSEQCSSEECSKQRGQQISEPRVEPSRAELSRAEPSRAQKAFVDNKYHFQKRRLPP